MKKPSTALLLILTLALNMLVMHFEVRKVEANGVIYIRANGQIDPQTAPIKRNGDIYTLTQDIISNNSGIIIEKSNIILNGANHTIQGLNFFDSKGIYLNNVSNVIIKDTKIKGFHYGMMFFNSSHNSVIENTIEANNYGIWLNNSSCNHFYHNNFLNNSYHVFLQNSINLWDNDYPSGGNYWSGYNNTDLYSGPNQNQPNSDGICDEPRKIDANNIDNYPLVKVWRGPVRNLVTGESYFTIQQAIDNAETNERILALIGIYYENIIINKNLELLGECPNSTIINGNWKGITININVSGVKIKGFTVKNGSPTNLLIFNSSNNIITENYIMSGEYGICLNGSSNNNIFKNIVQYAKYGISIYNSSKNNVNKNNITSCSDSAIKLIHSNHNNISQNVIEKCFNGIELSYSSNNVLTKNIARLNHNCGIRIDSGSNYNFIDENIVEQNENDGIKLYSSTHNNICKNSIILNADSGIFLYMCSNYNQIVKNNLTGNYKGIALMAFSNNNSVSENDLENNRYGIIIDSSENNTILENNVTASIYCGVYLYSSLNNNITGNKIKNGFTGIFLYMSSKNSVIKNLLTDNKYNFGVDGKNMSHFINRIDTSNIIGKKPVYYLINQQNFKVPQGAGYIALINCTNITVQNQNLEHNKQGILLAYTTNTTIEANSIADNEYGIYVYKSSNNFIYHNNFINNTRNIYSFNSVNTMDNGLEGNYWSDYVGQDLNRDGIGDSPYIVDENNMDAHPLMGTFSSYNTYIGSYVLVVSNFTIKEIECLKNSSTIKIYVLDNINQTLGFCRLTVPFSIISPPYHVTINNYSMLYTLIFENETISIIYFDNSSLIIQEFPYLLILPIFMTLTLLMVTLCRRKRFESARRK